MKCTHAGCSEGAFHTISDGIALCDGHHCTWQRAQERFLAGEMKAPEFASLWVKVQGGPEATAARMKPTIDTAVRLGVALQNLRARKGS